jgi:hypothetical protein
MIENSDIAKSIVRIGPIEEIEPKIMETPMIGDLCTEMYQTIPILAAVNASKSKKLSINMV